MMRRSFPFVLLGFLALAVCSCSGKKDYGKETYPVKGVVYVDGKPAERLSVTLHDVKGADPNVPATPRAVTTADGSFAVSTFEAGDGAPAGEYTVTFEWGELRGLSIDTSKDKLRGRYSDPAKSEFKVTVAESDEPVDMGRIELTSR
jgi:hypothetical protein